MDCFLPKKSIRDLQPRKNIPVLQRVPGEPLINIKHALDEVDLLDLENLYNCVRSTMPNHIQDRPFNAEGYGGGNNVTFIGGFIQLGLNELVDRLLDLLSHSADAAGWRYVSGGA